VNLDVSHPHRGARGVRGKASRAMNSTESRATLNIGVWDAVQYQSEHMEAIAAAGFESVRAFPRY